MDLDKMLASAERASDVMKLMGHKHRLMMLCELKMSEKSVGALSSTLGIMPAFFRKDIL